MESHGRGAVPADEMDFIAEGACRAFKANLPDEAAASCVDLQKAMQTMQWEKALDLAVTLHDRFPGSGLGYFWQGLIEMKRGNATAGLTYLESAVERAPELPLAHLNLGVAYAMTRRTELLEEQMQWMMDNQPQSPWPYYYLGRYVSEVLEEIEHGTELFGEALERDPEQYRARFHMGLNYELEGDLERAQAAYQAATSTADSQGITFAYPLLGQARVFRRQQDLGKAIQAARHAVSMDPSLPEGHLLLGSLYLQAGELEKAISSLKTTADLDPGNPTPHYMLARAYRKLGLFSEAQHEEEIFSRLRKQLLEESNS